MPRLLLPLLALACSDYEFVGGNDALGGGDTACSLDEADPYAVQSDASCAFEAEPGSFSPQVEWQWSGAVGAAGYDDVMMTPVVGDVDGDGLPEVVVTSYETTNYGGAGALTILSGDGSGEEGAWTSIGGYAPSGSGGVALGDLEGDGTPEIVVVTSDVRLLAMHADGSLLWASEPRAEDFSIYSYPAIADLDGDGLAEVIAGKAIFNSAGELLGSGEYGWGGTYGISAVADLDMDGQQEVVVGNAAYRRDGSALWYNGLTDGWTAVGDFDGDGRGEVVSVTTAGEVFLLETDGSPIWGPKDVPGGGGPPTVADFDGDGAPEVGVAGHSGYVVYDSDGSALWQAETTDESSARTGSSVFDFEGDGAWEVVYADELVLWVYDGATGQPVLEETEHSSWTLFEYPVIVDVDADGESEIVLASNDSINAGWQGVTVIGDASDSWAPTTMAWNQHAYHITNVQDDLSIPAQPTMNWEVGHNSYRAGGLRDQTGIPAPDLVPVLPALCWICDPPGADLLVQLENRGLSAVPAGVSVAAYAVMSGGTKSFLDAQTLDEEIPAGQASASLRFALDLPELGEVVGLSIEADDNGTTGGGVEECDEGNNALSVKLEGC